MSDLTNHPLIFCARCAAQGHESALRLESVGYLVKLRSVSYVCPACEHTTAVSLRQGSLGPPRPDQCWNCGSSVTGQATDRCRSCDAHLDLDAGFADGLWFTWPADQLLDITGEPGHLQEQLEAAPSGRDLTSALRAADAWTHRFPHDPAAWRAKAQLYLGHGFLGLALAAIKRSLLLQPGHVEALLHLVTILELLEEPDTALATAMEVVRLSEADPRGYAAAASLLLGLQRLDEAEALARQTIDIAPEWADAWSTLATVHMTRREFEPAVAAWQRLVEIAPDAHLAWRYLGLCHLYLQQWPQAVTAGRRAGDDDEEALEIVFEGQLQGERLEEAAEQARHAVELHPASPRFLYLEARVHLARGEFQAGLEVCDRILEIEPSAGWAKKARGIFADRLAAAPGE